MSLRVRFLSSHAKRFIDLSKFIRPLDILLGHLRQLAETTGPVPEWIRRTIEQRKHLLSIGNFPSPKEASKTKINGAGGVTLAGGHKTAALNEAEKTFVLEISGKLEVDEIEALVLLKSLLLQRKGPAAFQPTDQEEYEQTEDWWDEMQIFYFQERLAIYDILSLLLRLCMYDLLQVYLELTIHAQPSPKTSKCHLERNTATAYCQIFSRKMFHSRS